MLKRATHGTGTGAVTGIAKFIGTGKADSSNAAWVDSSSTNWTLTPVCLACILNAQPKRNDANTADKSPLECECSKYTYKIDQVNASTIPPVSFAAQTCVACPAGVDQTTSGCKTCDLVGPAGSLVPKCTGGTCLDGFYYSADKLCYPILACKTD